MDGYVLSWTYDLEEYNSIADRFKRGKLKRPPKLEQMWVETSEKAESFKAKFTAAHPRGGIKIEAGPPPKKLSMMLLSATLTNERITTF